MSRKTKTITISQEGRDKDKKFLITEMSAFHAENWASRAITAILNAGNNININPQMGMAGMAGMLSQAYSMLMGVKSEDIIPLWAELMQCVQFIPSGGQVRDLLINDEGGDIEEWMTIISLKKEVLMLHMGFLRSVAGQSFPQSESQ